MMRMDKLYYEPLDRVIDILLTLSFANILIKGVRIAEDYVYHVYDLNKADNLKERKIRTQLSFLRKLFVAVIIFVTIAIIYSALIVCVKLAPVCSLVLELVV